MEFTKKIEFDGESVRFQDKFTKKDTNRFLAAFCSLLICFAVTVFFLVYIKQKDSIKNNTGIFIAFLVLAIIEFILAIFIASYLLFRKKFKYNMLIDENAISIRVGSGYVIFSRFEIGSVLNNISPNSKFAIQGPGDKAFEIYQGGIKFNIGMKKIKTPIKDFAKLAYIMLNIAKNPESGINWGVAYSSVG